MDVAEDAECILEYDEEWLAILKSTDHLTNVGKEVYGSWKRKEGAKNVFQRVHLPSASNKNERYDFKPTEVSNLVSLSVLISLSRKSSHSFVNFPLSLFQ